MTAWKSILIVVLAAGMCLRTAAQEDRTAPPAPLVSPDGQDEPQNEQEMNPDTRPLTGAQPFTLGSVRLERSYLTPSIMFIQMADTNNASVPGQSSVDAVGSISGHLSLQKLWSRMRFTAQYIGGGTFDETNSRNLMFHQFGLSQSFSFRRWSLSLFDMASYTPQASFGYWGLSGQPVLPILNQWFTPNQSILTTQSSRWSNTAMGQVNYGLTPRVSLTALAGFSILRSSDSQFVNTGQQNYSLGLNYSATAKDTLGLVYINDRFGFGNAGNGRNLMTHNLQAAYGRRVTGRLALQLSGGPQLGSFYGAQPSSGLHASWAARAGMTYGLRQGSLRIFYWSGLTGGAGLLTGARTHALQTSVTRQLTRTLAGWASVGYAHNSSLNDLTSGAARSVFNSEYLGLGLTRPLGHAASVNLNYYLLHQSSNGVLCTALWCGKGLLQQIFGVGIDFHIPPMSLHL